MGREKLHPDVIQRLESEIANTYLPAHLARPEKFSHVVENFEQKPPADKFWVYSLRRRWVYEHIVSQAWFDYVVLIVILCNSVVLCLDDPLEADGREPKGTLQKVVEILDWIFLSLFTLEMLLKFVALGLWRRTSEPIIDENEPGDSLTDASDQHGTVQVDEAQEAYADREYIDIQTSGREPLGVGAGINTPSFAGHNTPASFGFDTPASSSSPSAPSQPPIEPWCNGGGYFQDRWNVLDFAIVLLGYLSVLPGFTNVSVVRLFRLLRAVRLMDALPGLRVVVESLLVSVPKLTQVGVLLGFIFLVYGIVGVQLWNGKLHQQCYMDASIGSGALVHGDGFCDLGASTGRNCPTNQTCLEVGSPPDAGLRSFDNFPLALLTVFAGVTSDWAHTLYAISDAWAPQAYIFFFTLILLISLFSINLVLAVVANTFQQLSREEKLRAARDRHVEDTVDYLHERLRHTQGFARLMEQVGKSSCNVLHSERLSVRSLDSRRFNAFGGRATGGRVTETDADAQDVTPEASDGRVRSASVSGSRGRDQQDHKIASRSVEMPRKRFLHPEDRLRELIDSKGPEDSVLLRLLWQRDEQWRRKQQHDVTSHTEEGDVTASRSQPPSVADATHTSNDTRKLRQVAPSRPLGGRVKRREVPISMVNDAVQRFNTRVHRRHSFSKWESSERVLVRRRARRGPDAGAQWPFRRICVVIPALRLYPQHKDPHKLVRRGYMMWVPVCAARISRFEDSSGQYEPSKESLYGGDYGLEDISETELVADSIPGVRFVHHHAHDDSVRLDSLRVRLLATDYDVHGTQVGIPGDVQVRRLGLEPGSENDASSSVCTAFEASAVSKDHKTSTHHRTSRGGEGKTREIELSYDSKTRNAEHTRAPAGLHVDMSAHELVSDEKSTPERFVHMRSHRSLRDLEANTHLNTLMNYDTSRHSRSSVEISKVEIAADSLKRLRTLDTLQESSRRFSLSGSAGSRDCGGNSHISSPMEELSEEREVTRMVEDALETAETRRRRLTAYHESCCECTRAAYRLVASVWFEAVIIVCIVLNTAVLAMDHFGIEDEMTSILEKFNLSFTVVFALEMLIKHIGIGYRLYWTNPWDAFDGVIVIVSLVELTPFGAASGAFSVLRTFRLLRVMKLAKSLHSLRVLLGTLAASLQHIAYMTLLLMLFLFIFALLGHQMFAGKMPDSVTGALQEEFKVFGQDIVPFAHTNTASMPYMLDDARLFGTGAPFESIGTVESDDSRSMGGRAHDHHIVGESIEAYDGITDDAVSSFRPAAPHAIHDSADMTIMTVGSPPTTYVSSTVFDLSQDYPENTRVNFDDLYWSLLTVLRVITADGWFAMMASTVAHTSGWAIFYYLAVILFGVYVVINLFIAIILMNFAEQDEAKFEREDTFDKAVKFVSQPNYNRKNALLIISDGVLTRRRKQREVRRKRAQKATITRKVHRMQGRSCGKFTAEWRVRRFTWGLVHHWLFELVVILAIFVNCVFLAMEHPFVDSDSDLANTLFVADVFFVVFFTVEMLLKVMAMGVYNKVESLQHGFEDQPDEAYLMKSSGYFNSKWNALDGFVVFAGIVSLAFPAFSVARALRALRPLRVIVRSSQIKVVVSSLWKAVPAIGNVFVFSIFIWMIFGILGVNLFKGRLYSCNDDAISLKSACTGTFVDALGNTVSRRWVNAPVHFDNIAQAIIALFQVATLAWSDTMFRVVDSTGSTTGPDPYSVPHAALFFVLFIIVGAFFAMNLFIGVVIDNFQRLKQEFDGSAFLTAEQRKWLNTQKLIKTVSLSATYSKPENAVRRFCFTIVQWSYFDHVILLLIFLNVCVMATQHYGQSEAFDKFLSDMNITFVVLFTVEAVLKILAYGFAEYWFDSWNKFDFILVVLSYFGFVLDTGVGANVIRVFRIARVFRVIKRAYTLKRMLDTLIISIPSLWNIGSLLVVVFFIYGVLAMNFFGRVRFSEGGLNEHANFRTFGTAMLTLYRMATTDSWSEVMAGCTISSPDCGVDADGEDDCGSQIAPLFFISFMVFGAMVMVQLYIAVILENFADTDSVLEASTGKGSGAFDDDLVNSLHEWAASWKIFDTRARKVLHCAQLEFVMVMAPPPFGLGMQVKPVTMLRFFKKLAIPIRGTVVKLGDESNPNTLLLPPSRLKPHVRMRLHSDSVRGGVVHSVDDVKHADNNNINNHNDNDNNNNNSSSSTNDSLSEVGRRRSSDFARWRLESNTPRRKGSVWMSWTEEGLYVDDGSTSHQSRRKNGSGTPTPVAVETSTPPPPPPSPQRLRMPREKPPGVQMTSLHAQDVDKERTNTASMRPPAPSQPSSPVASQSPSASPTQTPLKRVTTRSFTESAPGRVFRKRRVWRVHFQDVLQKLAVLVSGGASVSGSDRLVYGGWLCCGGRQTARKLREDFIIPVNQRVCVCADGPLFVDPYGFAVLHGGSEFGEVTSPSLNLGTDGTDGTEGGSSSDQKSSPNNQSSRNKIVRTHSSSRDVCYRCGVRLSKRQLQKRTVHMKKLRNAASTDGGDGSGADVSETGCMSRVWSCLSACSTDSNDEATYAEWLAVRILETAWLARLERISRRKEANFFMSAVMRTRRVGDKKHHASLASDEKLHTESPSKLAAVGMGRVGSSRRISHEKTLKDGQIANGSVPVRHRRLQVQGDNSKPCPTALERMLEGNLLSKVSDSLPMESGSEHSGVDSQSLTPLTAGASTQHDGGVNNQLQFTRIRSLADFRSVNRQSTQSHLHAERVHAGKDDAVNLNSHIPAGSGGGSGGGNDGGSGGGGDVGNMDDVTMPGLGAMSVTARDSVVRAAVASPVRLHGFHDNLNPSPLRVQSHALTLSGSGSSSHSAVPIITVTLPPNVHDSEQTNVNGGNDGVVGDGGDGNIRGYSTSIENDSDGDIDIEELHHGAHSTDNSPSAEDGAGNYPPSAENEASNDGLSAGNGATGAALLRQYGVSSDFASALTRPRARRRSHITVVRRPHK